MIYKIFDLKITMFLLIRCILLLQIKKKVNENLKFYNLKKYFYFK